MNSPALAPGRPARAWQFDGHRLQRMAGIARREVLAPADAPRRGWRLVLEAAVRRPQRRQRDAECCNHGTQAAVRAQPRPAGASERKHQHVGAHAAFAVGCTEAQQAWPRASGRRRPTQPAMAHVELHTLGAQPVQPGTQQRSSLHVAWKHPARATDEGVDAQPGRPVAQLLRRKATQQCTELGCPRAVARDEGLEILRMRQVQSALAGQQELAPDRRHGVVEVHRRTADGQHLGGHQAGRPATDHDRAGFVCHPGGSVAHMRQTLRQGIANAIHGRHRQPGCRAWRPPRCIDAGLPCRLLGPSRLEEPLFQRRPF